MASEGSKLNMSEETFEYTCTACAEDDLIKEALKFCVECQQYCCEDCLSAHKKISSLKGHTLLNNSVAKTQGSPRSLPACPTQQCSKHVGMIMYMYCEDHDDVCCYICAAENHRTCKDVVSISENIDKLYSETDASKAITDVNTNLDSLHLWQTKTDTLLQRLRDSKAAAIKSVSDFRIEMEKLLKKLEEASVNEIENEFKKLEALLFVEKKRYESPIYDLNIIKQLIEQATGNNAQLFICTKLAQKKCASVENSEMNIEKFYKAEVMFLASKELKSNLEKMMNLGESSAKSSKIYTGYKATKIGTINCRLEDDKEHYSSPVGACIVNDTVVFTDKENEKLKRFDVSSLSFKDHCEVPDGPRGVCTVSKNEIAVACQYVVQFVKVDDNLSLSHAIGMKHKSHGIAYNDEKLYIADGDRSLYMYDMSGNLLKTVNTDDNGDNIFDMIRHVAFNKHNDTLYVSNDFSTIKSWNKDNKKGLVCLNAQCDVIKTISDSNARPDVICVDSYGNLMVTNINKGTIMLCGKDGQRRCDSTDEIYIFEPDNMYSDEEDSDEEMRRTFKSVCIHHGRKRMFVCLSDSPFVLVYDLELYNKKLYKRLPEKRRALNNQNLVCNVRMRNVRKGPLMPVSLRKKFQKRKE